MKLAVSLLSALFIAGCATPLDDLLNNRFAEIVAEPVTEQYTGVRTGTSGPWLVTVSIHEDGTGVYCSSWNERNFVGNVKMANGVIYFQDGSKSRVSLDGSVLIADYDGAGAAQIRFVPDAGLKEASPYCKNQMSNQ